MGEKLIGKINKIVIPKISGKYSLTYGNHYYDLYFTDKHIIGKYIGSAPNSLMVTPIGIYLTPYKEKKKEQEMNKVEIPEKLLKGESLDFLITYSDINRVVIKRSIISSSKIVKIEFKRNLPGVGKKLYIKIFHRIKKDQDKIIKLFTETLPPDKVIIL